MARLMPVGKNNLIIRCNNRLLTEKHCAYIDDQWFKLFRYDFVEGSVSKFNSDPFSIILTKSTAKRYFGKVDAVGKVLNIDSINVSHRLIHVPIG